MSPIIDAGKLSRIVPITGVILFIYIILDIGLDRITYTFSMIPPLYYIAALLVFTPKLLLATYKWWYISSKQRINLPCIYLAKLFLMSLFYASLTPGALGLHVRIYYMKKRSGESIEKCIANSFIDSTSGIIGGIILATVGSLIYINLTPGLLPILVIILLFYGSAFIFFMEKKRGSRFLHILIYPFLPDKYHKNLDQIIDLLYKDLPSLNQLILPFILELIIWTIAASQVYVLAQAFNITIPYLEFIVISVVSVVLATTIPITVGGLGVREGTFVILLSQYGVPSEIAFVLSLSGFLVKNFIPGVIGLILFLIKPEEGKPILLPGEEF